MEKKGIGTGLKNDRIKAEREKYYVGRV